MSDSADDPGMKKQRRVADVEALIREIQRYLSYLDALRGRTPEPPAKKKPK